MGSTALAQLEFGLSAQIVNSLRDVFSRFPGVLQVLIYGSRATGKYRRNSDIDRAVFAPAMKEGDFSRLWTELDDLPILFKLDVIHFDEITNPSLQSSIA